MDGHVLKLYSEILEERGEKRGRKKEKISLLRKMIDLGKLTISEAAEIAGMSTDAFKKMAML